MTNSERELLARAFSSALSLRDGVALRVAPITDHDQCRELGVLIDALRDMLWPAKVWLGPQVRKTD